MIKGVLFDLSEVLLTGVKESGEQLGIRHDLDTENHPLRLPIANSLFRGDISESEFLNEVVGQYPMVGSVEELFNYIRSGFHEVEGTRTIIKQLQSLGLRLGLLSIHAKEWIEYCESKFNYHQYFHGLYYSYDGIELKPHAESYWSALRGLGLKPEETLFIDDSVTNVRAARELGMHGIVFTDAVQLDRDLKEILPNYNSFE
jgi:putative hydrolase of the HAD superfamily